MRSNKYLIMKINGESGTFVNSNFSGGRCCSPNDNTTEFRSHDFGDGHENDDYWNYCEDLLIGFCRWYKRVDEEDAHHMGNRIYTAIDTYRFFKVDSDDQLVYANCDLSSYEIDEVVFVKDMLNSWAFSQVSLMFCVGNFVTYRREEPSPVKVTIVINEETNTWCWTSDYLNEEDYSQLYSVTKTIPAGKNYKDAVEYISCTSGCDYRFGGNDAWNKRNNK